MKRSEHAAVAEAFAAYTHASKPTAALTHELLNAVATMISVDHETSIAVMMHGLVVIKREPVATASRLRKAV